MADQEELRHPRRRASGAGIEEFRRGHAVWVNKERAALPPPSPLSCARTGHVHEVPQEVTGPPPLLWLGVSLRSVKLASRSEARVSHRGPTGPLITGAAHRALEMNMQQDSFTSCHFV